MIYDLETVMTDPTVHKLTKHILTECCKHDPVDALDDLRLAKETWEGVVDRYLGTLPSETTFRSTLTHKEPPY